MNPRWPEKMRLLYMKRLTAGNLVLAFGMRSLDNECVHCRVPSTAAPLFIAGIYRVAIEL